MENELYRALASIETAQAIATPQHVDPGMPRRGQSTDSLDRLSAALHFAAGEVSALLEEHRAPEGQEARLWRALASLETAQVQLPDLDIAILPTGEAHTDALDRLGAALASGVASLGAVLESLTEAEAA